MLLSFFLLNVAGLFPLNRLLFFFLVILYFIIENQVKTFLKEVLNFAELIANNFS